MYVENISSILSGLAYLALCRWIAAFSLRRQGPGENSGWRFYASPALLLGLSSFLLIPCGRLPALYPVPGGALIAAALLAAASGCGRWQSGRRRIITTLAPLSLAVALALMAQYARQRGVPGELYALDAYVAMPLASVAEGAARPGVWILAVASLLPVWMALAPPLAKTLPTEIWRLALVSYWVCLFLPFSFTYPPAWISLTLGLALDAILFWCKTLAIKWLLEKFSPKACHALILLTLWTLAAGLLLSSA